MIRLYRPSDFNRVSAIVVELFGTDGLEFLQDCLKESHESIVYCKRKRIVGFAIATLKKRGYCAELIGVSIHDQGRGIGTQMMHYLQKRKRHIRLYVHETNTDVMKWYRTLGFRKRTTIDTPDFYGHLFTWTDR